MSLNVLILGVNGFIGSSLTERILADTDWQVYGLDLDSYKLGDSLNHQRFHFQQGDIASNKNWIEEHIKHCDIVLPLVAIASPSLYVEKPLLVFELDFESNLEIVRQCVKYKKHVVFPSTSEVYGMSPDVPFEEFSSSLVLGPINKERWIYSCSKQLLDRIIFAYGAHEGLSYTLFRPFNWIGGRLDNLAAAKNGKVRVLTQFIANILNGKPIELVDGGEQRRCFTYIDDGIDGLMRIIRNYQGAANKQIFNLGNPDNNYSVKQLAEMLVAEMKKIPAYQAAADKAVIKMTDAGQYYGEGYQDVANRVPSIEHAKKLLDWHPQYDMQESLRLTLEYHLQNRK